MLSKIFLLHAKCRHMTLAINLLNGIFPCILKCKTIISSLPMCYVECLLCSINSHLKRLLTLMNNILLAISGHATVKPLGIKVLTKFLIKEAVHMRKRKPRPMVRRVLHKVCGSCAPTSTDSIYTTKLMLHN
jgi:hypothetical protein